MSTAPKEPYGPFYWIEWCSSSYRRSLDGFTTHAVADPNNEVPGNGRALCGVRTDEAGGGLIPEDGEPGCIRCRAALRKLGVLTRHEVARA